MSERRHWYHCSTVFHGERWLAKRKAPFLEGLKEPRTPRLCVAANVARCFAARLFSGDVFVYRTEKERRTVRPVGVWDATITQERWLIPPVPMVFDCIIQSGIVERACRPTWERLKAKLEKYPDASFEKMPPGVSPLDRLISFQEAIDALGPEFCSASDRRFVRRMLDWCQSREGAVAA